MEYIDKTEYIVIHSDDGDYVVDVGAGLVDDDDTPEDMEDE